MRPPQDMQRELQKVLDAVVWVCDALEQQGRADAAMHMNPVVRYNPATVNLMQAREDLERLISELND